MNDELHKDWQSLFGIKVVTNEHIPGDVVIVKNGRIDVLKMIEAHEAVAAERARVLALYELLECGELSHEKFRAAIERGEPEAKRMSDDVLRLHLEGGKAYPYCKTCGLGVIRESRACPVCALVAKVVAAAYADSARIADEKTLVLSCSHDGHGIPDAIRQRAREVAEKETK